VILRGVGGVMYAIEDRVLPHTHILGYGIIKIVFGGFQKPLQYFSIFKDRYPEDGPKTGG
jgi:hypothetical protein